MRVRAAPRRLPITCAGSRYRSLACLRASLFFDVSTWSSVALIWLRRVEREGARRHPLEPEPSSPQYMRPRGDSARPTAPSRLLTTPPPQATPTPPSTPPQHRESAGAQEALLACLVPAQPIRPQRSQTRHHTTPFDPSSTRTEGCPRGWPTARATRRPTPDCPPRRGSAVCAWPFRALPCTTKNQWRRPAHPTRRPPPPALSSRWPSPWPGRAYPLVPATRTRAARAPPLPAQRVPPPPPPPRPRPRHHTISWS